jgi:hypothetical protein
LTVLPSVWRETGCESHFFLWRHEVDWLEWYGMASSTSDVALLERVEASLHHDAFRSVHEIAFEIDASLHEVFKACQELAADNRAVEGTGRERGCFRLRNG